MSRALLPTDPVPDAPASADPLPAQGSFPAVAAEALGALDALGAPPLGLAERVGLPAARLAPVGDEAAGRSAFLAAGAAVAIGRRAGRAQVTALVLSLRRRAEADAQEQLRRVRAHLELAWRNEAQAQRQLEQARQELQALTAALRPVAEAEISARTKGSPVASSAQLVASQAARLLRQRQRVRACQREVAAQTGHVQALLRTQSELHETLRRALALREAAELHESAELREQRRARAQRQRTLEEEARDRFLSAQRQLRPPR